MAGLLTVVNTTVERPIMVQINEMLVGTKDRIDAHLSHVSSQAKRPTHLTSSPLAISAHFFSSPSPQPSSFSTFPQ